MRTIINLLIDWAVENRIIYNEYYHGLPPARSIEKKKKPIIKKTAAANNLTYRTGYDVPTKEIVENGSSVTKIIKEGETLGEVLEGRSIALNDTDRHFIKEVFKYKSLETVIKKETTFQEVKKWWAKGKSIKEIEERNVGIKERSITKCFTAFRLSLEHQQSERGEGVPP